MVPRRSTTLPAVVATSKQGEAGKRAAASKAGECRTSRQADAVIPAEHEAIMARARASTVDSQNTKTTFFRSDREMTLRTLWFAHKTTAATAEVWCESAASFWFDDDRFWEADFKHLIEVLGYAVSLVTRRLRRDIEQADGWTDETFDLHLSYQVFMGAAFDDVLGLEGHGEALDMENRGSGYFYEVMHDYYGPNYDAAYGTFWGIEDEESDEDSDHDTLYAAIEGFLNGTDRDEQQYNPERYYVYRMSRTVKVSDRTKMMENLKSRYAELALRFYDDAFVRQDTNTIESELAQMLQEGGDCAQDAAIQSCKQCGSPSRDDGVVEAMPQSHEGLPELHVLPCPHCGQPVGFSSILAQQGVFCQGCGGQAIYDDSNDTLEATQATSALPCDRLLSRRRVFDAAADFSRRYLMHRFGLGEQDAADLLNDLELSAFMQSHFDDLLVHYGPSAWADAVEAMSTFADPLTEPMRKVLDRVGSQGDRRLPEARERSALAAGSLVAPTPPDAPAIGRLLSLRAYCRNYLIDRRGFGSREAQLLALDPEFGHAIDDANGKWLLEDVPPRADPDDYLLSQDYDSPVMAGINELLDRFADEYETREEAIVDYLRGIGHPLGAPSEVARPPQGRGTTPLDFEPPRDGSRLAGTWWQGLLGKDGFAACREEVLDEIIRDLLVPDEISPRVFGRNFLALLCEDWRQSGEYLGRAEDTEPPASLYPFIPAWNRPVGFPLWFIAAYPDVVRWYQGQLAESRGEYGNDSTLILRLLGLDPEAGGLTEDDVLDGGEIRPSSLRHLVATYKVTTGKALDSSVDTVDSPEDDMYLGAQLLERSGSASNFELIAENTTKFYMELSSEHAHRFTSEASLLATAGVLDAIRYIQEELLHASEIAHIAQASVEDGGDPLVQFVVNLEAKLFYVHEQEMSFSEIKEACIDQKETIAKAIERTRNGYPGDPFLALVISEVVSEFMTSQDFATVRESLAIKG